MATQPTLKQKLLACIQLLNAIKQNDNIKGYSYNEVINLHNTVETLSVIYASFPPEVILGDASTFAPVVVEQPIP